MSDESERLLGHKRSRAGSNGTDGHVTDDLIPEKRSEPWTEEQKTILLLAIEKFGVNDWCKVASLIPTKNDMECQAYWEQLSIRDEHSQYDLESKKQKLKISGMPRPSEMTNHLSYANDHNAVMYQAQLLQQYQQQQKELLQKLEQNKTIGDMLAMQLSAQLSNQAMMPDMFRPNRYNPTGGNSFATSGNMSPPLSPPLVPRSTHNIRYPYYSLPGSTITTGRSSSCNTPPEQTQDSVFHRQILANVLHHNLQILAQQQQKESEMHRPDELPKSYPNGRPISGAVPGTENTGRWTDQEHQAFLRGLNEHGTRHWTDIANVVKTRTVVQVRTHAQKYFKKFKAAGVPGFEDMGGSEPASSEDETDSKSKRTSRSEEELKQTAEPSAQVEEEASPIVEEPVLLVVEKQVEEQQIEENQVEVQQIEEKQVEKQQIEGLQIEELPNESE